MIIFLSASSSGKTLKKQVQVESLNDKIIIFLNVEFQVTIDRKLAGTHEFYN